MSHRNISKRACFGRRLRGRPASHVCPPMSRHLSRCSYSSTQGNLQAGQMLRHFCSFFLGFLGVGSVTFSPLIAKLRRTMIQIAFSAKLDSASRADGLRFRYITELAFMLFLRRSSVVHSLPRKSILKRLRQKELGR